MLFDGRLRMPISAKIRNERIVKAYSTGKFTQTQLGDKYGISQSAVSYIIRTHLARTSLKDPIFLTREPKVKKPR
jgi:predicted transcriptional regulator